MILITISVFIWGMWTVRRDRKFINKHKDFLKKEKEKWDEFDNWARSNYIRHHNHG